MKPEWGADEISMRDNILGEGLRDPFKLNVRRVVLHILRFEVVGICMIRVCVYPSSGGPVRA